MTKYKKSEFGKYVLAYLPKNDGAVISDVEKIDQYTEYRESSESHFGIQFEVFANEQEVVERIYQLKRYISMLDAQEIFNEFTI